MTNGVFAVALAALFLRERLTGADVVAGAVCLAGAIVVAGPDPDAPNWISLGALAALAQAFTWGVELVLIRFAAVRDAPERALVVVNGTACLILAAAMLWRSEEHTSELQSLMRISSAVFSLQTKTQLH